MVSLPQNGDDSFRLFSSDRNSATFGTSSCSISYDCSYIRNKPARCPSFPKCVVHRRYSFPNYSNNMIKKCSLFRKQANRTTGCKVRWIRSKGKKQPFHRFPQYHTPACTCLKTNNNHFSNVDTGAAIKFTTLE